MWKKDEATPAAPQPTPVPAPRGRDADAPPPRANRSADAPAAADPRAAAREPATIGPSITIKGEVTGDEDLLIQGTVDGSVDLGHHAVQVGREGRVKANISGRVVTVEGDVEGDLRAEEQIVLRPSADVKGDITAPRIVLEDGARFRGMVEMGEPPSNGKGAAKKEVAKATAAARDDDATLAGTGKSGNAGSAAKDAPAAGAEASDGSSRSDKTDRSGKADASDKRSGSSKPEPAKVGGEAR